MRKLLAAILLITVFNSNAQVPANVATETTQLQQTLIDLSSNALAEIENFSDFDFENLQSEDHYAIIQEMIRQGNTLTYLSHNLNEDFELAYPSYEEYRNQDFNPQVLINQQKIWRENTKNSVVSLIGSMGYTAEVLKNLEATGAIEILERFGGIGSSRNQQIKGLGAITGQVNTQLQALRQTFLDQMQAQEQFRSQQQTKQDFGRAMFDDFIGIDENGDPVDLLPDTTDGDIYGGLE